MRKTLFFFLIWLTSLFASYPGDSLAWQGVQKFYNYETSEAIVILQQARKTYPTNPTVHLTWVAARWLHSQANDPIPETYRLLDTDLDTVIPIYEKLTAQYPDDPYYQLYLGSAIGLKARIYLGKKDWFNTLLWAYRGFNRVQGVAEEHPEIYDAQLPIGVAEFYASSSNFLVQLAATLFGLHPTAESGLEKIESAAAKGEWSWIEAKGILSFIYLWVKPDFSKALLHSRDLVKNFPQNYYFQVLYSESLLRSDSLVAAQASLKSLDAMYPTLTATQQKWYFGYRSYEWALYYFLTGDYDQALVQVEEAIERYGAELDIILANAYLLAGMLNDLQGNREAAVAAYKSCRDLDNFTTAVQSARQYLRQPYQGVK